MNLLRSVSHRFPVMTIGTAFSSSSHTVRLSVWRASLLGNCESIQSWWTCFLNTSALLCHSATCLFTSHYKNNFFIPAGPSQEMTHTVLANPPDTRCELHSEQLVNKCAIEYMLWIHVSISVVITVRFLVKNRLKQVICWKSLLKSQLSSLK